MYFQDLKSLLVLWDRGIIYHKTGSGKYTHSQKDRDPRKKRTKRQGMVKAFSALIIPVIYVSLQKQGGGSNVSENIISGSGQHGLAAS